MRMGYAVSILLLLACSPLLASDNSPKTAVTTTTFPNQLSVLYTFNRTDFNGYKQGTANIQGGTLQYTRMMTAHLGLTTEGSFGRSPSVQSTYYDVAAGPRVQFGFDRVSPYVQALFGYSHIVIKPNDLLGHNSGFAFIGGFGADLHLTSSWSLRLGEFDFLRQPFGQHRSTWMRYSAGITYNWGK